MFWGKGTGGSTAEGIPKIIINKLTGAGEVPESGAKVKSPLPSESNDRAMAAGTCHWMRFKYREGEQRCRFDNAGSGFGRRRGECLQQQSSRQDFRGLLHALRPRYCDQKVCPT